MPAQDRADPGNGTIFHLLRRRHLPLVYVEVDHTCVLSCLLPMLIMMMMMMINIYYYYFYYYGVGAGGGG